MSPKTIAIIVLVVLLFLVAGQPIGLAIADIGHGLQTFGQAIESFGKGVHL